MDFITPKTSVKASYTNDSVLESLFEIPDVKEKGIDRVIALCSWNVKNKKIESYSNQTAFEYYSALCSCKNIVNIFSVDTTIENENYRDINTVLNEVLCHLSDVKKDDKIYIDSSGGARKISNLLPSLVNLLKYKGIRNIKVLYSDKNSSKSCVTGHRGIPADKRHR